MLKNFPPRLIFEKRIKEKFEINAYFAFGWKERDVEMTIGVENGRKLVAAIMAVWFLWIWFCLLLLSKL